MKVDPQIAGKLPLFQGLDPELRGRLLEGARIRAYANGELLFAEGGEAECLFVLLHGIVELFTSASGRDADVLIVWPPETFLPAAALTDEPYLLSARALGDSRLLLLDAEKMRREARLNADLAHRITQILSGQFRMLVRHIKDLKLRSGPERLAAFLLKLVDEMGSGGAADLPIPKGRLASRLDLSPETLSRAFRTLGDHGLSVRGGRVVIVDRARMERFCTPDPLIDGREFQLSVTAI